MKKYYYKNDTDDVYTNDPNVFDTNTKPITACYSGRFYRNGIDNDQVDIYNSSSHSPWFCMKDGKYPIYSLTDLTSHFDDSTFKGFRKIFDFTVSSLSGQYFLNPSTSTNPTNVYTNYRIPYTTPYLQTLDWIVDNENLFENVNIQSATKLQWKMKTDLITEFHTYTQGPNSYNGDTDGFVLKISMRGTKAIKNDVSGLDIASGRNILGFNYMDFTNVTPTVIWHKETNGINGELKIHGTENKPGEFSVNVPPHFTLKKSEFPTDATGIKIKIDGLFLHSNFTKNNYYFPDDEYINNTATFNAGIKNTNCLGLIYQSNDITEWQWNNDASIDYLNNNYSATFEYVPDGVGNKLKNKSTVKTTNRTDCLNYWYYPEKQELNNPEFWNNIFVYSANTTNSGLYFLQNKNDKTDSGYMYISANPSNWEFAFNMSAVDDYYDISCSNFLINNKPMTNMDGDSVDFSANDRFIIYASPGALETDYNKPYYKCESYNYWKDVTSTTNNYLPLSALTSNNDSLTSYISEARDGWKWNPTGNAPSRNDFTANNYNFSHCTMEYIIPKLDVTSQYLHISYPITTVNCGHYGLINRGIVLEYTLTYEFVK